MSKSRFSIPANTPHNVLNPLGLRFSQFEGGTAEQIFAPVTFIDAAGKEVVADTQAKYDVFSSMPEVYKLKPTETPQRGRNSNFQKRELTNAEADAMQDKNLSEALAQPSTLVKKGAGFEFEVKILKILNQLSKRTGNEYPSTQVEWNGIKFCILYDSGDRKGNTLQLVLKKDELGVSPRTGVTIERRTDNA